MWLTPPFTSHHIGGFEAFDATTGTGLWQAPDAEGQTQPAIASGIVYISNGSLRAYDSHAPTP